MDGMIARINELYHKSQAEGLTEAEKEEQNRLRHAYAASVRNNLRGQLNNISIVEKDGSVTNLGEKYGKSGKNSEKSNNFNKFRLNSDNSDMKSGIKSNTKSSIKSNIRKEMLDIRNSMPPLMRKEKSDKILSRLYDTVVYKNARIILTYVDYKSEVQTAPLIDRALKDSKEVFCPKVRGDDMDFYRINAITELKEGYKGIREPDAGVLFEDAVKNIHKPFYALIVVPGAVFDVKCNRIGYGKGFYDRFLTRVSEKYGEACIHTVGLGFDCQLVNEAPCEEHDKKLNMIITDNNIYGRDLNVQLG